MSEITLNVADAERSVHAHIHVGFADQIVATLAADPESIEELEAARGRFSRRDHDCESFSTWPDGPDHQPWDAGIVYIDLAARLIASRSTYSSPVRQGEVNYHDGRQATRTRLYYQLDADWMITGDIDAHGHISQQRRQKRLGEQPLDVRAVIYGKLAEFIVRQVHARRGSGSSRWDSCGHGSLLWRGETAAADRQRPNILTSYHPRDRN